MKVKHNIKALQPRSNVTTKITTNSFLARLDSELALIELTSIDDPSLSQEARLNKAQLRKFMRYVDNASYISLSSPMTIQGLEALVAFGLLTNERKTEVLDPVVTAEEQF